MIEIPPNRRRGVGHFIRNVAISIVALLVLLVGGGVAYTWYSGRQPLPGTAVAQVSDTPTRTTVKPTQPKPDAPVGVSTQTLTSPVTPGSNAGLTIKTNANAKCTISVIYDKTPSKDSGLITKTADEYGMVTWSWTVDQTAPIGKWPVTASCANAKNSGLVRADLEVVKTLPADSSANTTSSATTATN